MGMSNLVAQTGMEVVQISIPAEWKFLVFIFGALFVIDLFVPMFLYADGTKRGLNGLAWAAGAFFTMSLLEVAGIASGSFGVWVLLTVLALIAPYVYLFIYLIRRSPASRLTCPTCGSELESSWSTCPYCEQGAPALGAAPALAVAGAAPAVAPQQLSMVPGTSVGRRSGGSTMIKPREDKRTIRSSSKKEGAPLGWMVITRGPGSGKEYKVTGEQTTIGRDSSNDLVLSSDVEVSRQHARLRVESGKFIIYDLGSANGTHLNGEDVQKAILDDGDTIRIGETELVFKKV